MPRLTSTTSRQFSVAAPDQSKSRFVSTDFASRQRLVGPGVGGSNFSQHGFGGCIALWSDHYVVGAPFDQNNGGGFPPTNVGRAYLVDAATQTAVANWLEPTATASTFYAHHNPAGSPLNLHSPVALNTDRVFVGASQNGTGGSNRGVVHVFSRADNSLETTIASPGTDFGWFGATLACTDRWLIVGSPGHNPGSNPEQGRVYVLDLEDSFSVVQTIDISRPNNTSSRFGNAIAVYGNYLVAGEPNWLTPEGGLNINNNGRCRVWTLDPFELIYTKENPNITGTVALDVFGTAVAISGNHFAASAPGEDTTGTNQGVVYIFDLSTGELARTLENPNQYSATATDDYFGNRIALTDQYVAVAATEERALDNLGNPEQDHGVVYLFNTATGDLVETYQNPVFNSQALMNQGMGLAMNDQFLVIGAPGFNNNVGFTEVYKLGLPSASYSITAAANSINEGSSLTFTVATANVRNGTVLRWRIIDRPGDFSVNTGVVTVTSNAVSFTVTPTADLTTEGPETFRVQLEKLLGTVIATSSSITINDTSNSLPPTYALASADNINEGSTLEFTVTTTKVDDGTVLYWTIETGASEFSVTSGTVTINSNSGTFSVTPTADETTEGSETFTVALRADSVAGDILDTSDSITINDTSTGAALSGEITFLEPGTYTWTAPAGVTEVSVVAVGGGGGGGFNGGAGGGGGGIGYGNAISVTPGNTYTVFVGRGTSNGFNASFRVGSQSSYFIDTSTVAGLAGGNGASGSTVGGAGGSFVGDGGGQGGEGGSGLSSQRGGGGGGAGGYNGTGGRGGNQNADGTAAATGTGAGGGGAGHAQVQGGGGVGLFGIGNDGGSGTRNVYPSGTGGSSGGDGLTGYSQAGQGTGFITYQENSGNTINGDEVTFGTSVFSGSLTPFVGASFAWPANDCPADLYLVEYISGSTWRLNRAPSETSWNTTAFANRFIVSDVFNGGFPGGGGGGTSGSGDSSICGAGGHGAVRIIWGSGRSFPNAAGPIPDYIVSVVNSGASAYRVSGMDRTVYSGEAVTGKRLTRGNNRALTYTAGDLIAFCVNAPGHPLYIKTASSTGTGDQVSQGVTGQGTEEGTVYWDTTGIAAGTYYYQCSNHLGMNGEIIIT